MHTTSPIPYLIQRRRRWSAAEKAAIVHETFQPGASVSAVARRHGVNPSQLFQWRKAMEKGALVAVAKGEDVVPAKQYRDALKEIRQLQRILGKLTVENEILKEGMRVAREKNLISRVPRFLEDSL